MAQLEMFKDVSTGIKQSLNLFLSSFAARLLTANCEFSVHNLNQAQHWLVRL